MSKRNIVEPTKSVVDYSTTSPSTFDGRCVTTYKQISIWNRGRKASQGNENQKDWFNHFTRAILDAQEILEYRKMTKETEKTGVVFTAEQIKKRIKEAQWSYMKEVKIPKGYKSKCKKITLSSMKYKKPRILNKPDFETFSNRYLDGRLKTDSTYDKEVETIKKPKVPKFVSNYVNKEMVKLEARRAELLKEEQIEIERLKQAETKKSTTPDIENMQEQLKNITETLNLVVRHIARDIETKDKKPKKTLRFKD